MNNVATGGAFEEGPVAERSDDIPVPSKRGPMTLVRSVDTQQAEAKIAKAAKTSKKGGEVIVCRVPSLRLEVAEIMIVGDSSLLVHGWDEKTRKKIEEKQAGNKGLNNKQAREDRDPVAEFEAAAYLNSHGQHCVLARAIKSSIVESTRFIPGNMQGREFPATIARGMLQILGDLLPLTAPEPVMRTDMARLASGVCSPVYRPEYFPWAVKFHVKYNASIIGPADLTNLLTLAGFHSGLCEWRPERGGGFGMFHVASAEEFKAVEKAAKKAVKK